MSGQKWYLISTLDDHSRRILYADLWEKETSWSHIAALQSVITQFGCPLRYYVDNHSIFRYIERRDSMHRKIATRRRCQSSMENDFGRFRDSSRLCFITCS